MRYKATKSLSTLVAHTLQTGPYAGQWRTRMVYAAWQRAVADERAKIVRFFVKEQKLYVKLHSSLLQYELRLQGKALLDKVNKLLMAEGHTKLQLQRIIFLS